MMRVAKYKYTIYIGQNVLAFKQTNKQKTLFHKLNLICENGKCVYIFRRYRHTKRSVKSSAVVLDTANNLIMSAIEKLLNATAHLRICLSSQHLQSYETDQFIFYNIDKHVYTVCIFDW